MTIASKLETINDALGDIKSSIVAKGVTPTGDITTYSTAIESISTGDEITATNTTGSAVSADDRVWVEPVVNYTQNFSVGGNPAINNFTLTSTDYPNRSGIVYNMINPPSPQESVEVQLKGYINYNTSANYPNARTGYGDFSIYCRAPGSGGYPYESALSLFLGDGLTIKTNSEANTYTVLPRTSLVKDQMYWFKVLVTDNQIVASYSTDGSSWIDTTFSVSGLLAVFTKTYIGMSTATSEGYGTYDLLECYVKVDGQTVWTPYLASTTYSIINDTDITSTSFTGIAQEAIANDATGSVKTLLDGNGTYAPTTATKSITTNGTYTASAENAYGLSEVTVDVPTPDVWHNWRTDATTTVTNITMPSSATYRQMAFGNNKFVVVASTGIAYSSDGETNWTFSSTITGLYSIIFDGTKFVAVGTNKTAYSLDGINWTENTNSQDLRVIAYTNNKYIAINTSTDLDTYMYSEDGINWQSKQLPAMYGMAYACGGNGKFIIILGRSSETNVALYSGDGLTWSNVTLPSSGVWRKVVYGNNKFVAIHGHGSIAATNIGAYSEDGLTWLPMTLPSSGTWSALGYGNGIFVAAKGYNNTSYRSNLGAFSYDGINWTALTLNYSTYWRYICYGDGKFILTDDDGTTTLVNKVIINSSSVYTLTASPTTSTQVYEIPKKTSALTITAVGASTITLSDNKVYNRNSAGDVESPVLGTKTITSNDTYTAASDYLDGFSSVTVDVPSAPTKKYNLLDRVKDDSNNEIGTVSGFFTDANNVEYAVVCLDAVNRIENKKYLSSETVVSNIPQYQNQSVWSALETATKNTTEILATGSSTACTHCRSKSYTIEGNTYEGQLPNLPELVDIFRNRVKINANDPTAATSSSLVIPTTTNSWSSTQKDNSSGWVLTASGTATTYLKNTSMFVIPVLEIPNT